MQRSCGSRLSIALFAAMIAYAADPSVLRAQMAGGMPAMSMANPSGIVGLNEEEARFLPGLYYFHKGCDYYKRGQPEAAMHAWEVAAGWAMKDAQYNLGIAYFRGRGIDVDRPRGLAWLALAAERKDEAFETSLAAAWDDATPEEHDSANAIWRDLRPHYGDASALVRAQNHYRQEISQITGSRVGMSGHARVWTRSTGNVDAEAFKTGMQQLADRNFGKLPTGTVDIGPLQPVIDDGAGASN
ncbi:MAG TPA: hypothetical protein VH375_11520 [Rhodanobacteraceae bacterium]